MKPRTAAYVLLGLTMAWGLSSSFLLPWLSLFPGTLPDRPIYWWPDVSWVTVVAIFGGLLAAVFVEPFMKRSERPNRVLAAFIAATLAIGSIGQAGGMFGGVAIFSDRIERQTPWPWSPKETLSLNHIRHIEVGCAFFGPRSARPVINIAFTDGRAESIQGEMRGLLGQDRWLDAVLAVDRAASFNGAERVVSRDIDGEPNLDSRCLAKVAAQFKGGRSVEVLRVLTPPPGSFVPPLP